MLFVVTLTYARPMEEVNACLDAHRDWLVVHTQAGRIAAAGPLEPRTGGLILALCSDRAELDHMLDQDPFVAEGLVTVGIVSATLALRHADFAARWAPEAKAIVG